MFSALKKSPNQKTKDNTHKDPSKPDKKIPAEAASNQDI